MSEPRHNAADGSDETTTESPSSGIAADGASRDGETEAPDRATLEAEVEVLREENRRLRDEYARARRSEYRRTALVLSMAGLLGIAGGVLVSSARTVLLALGGTGVFIGVLTYYLTPERMLPATVGRDIYAAMSRTGESLVQELGLQEDRLYVPVDGASHGTRLFVPQHAEYTVPEGDALGDLFVIGDGERERGASVVPTGETLRQRFEEGRSGGEPSAPAEAAREFAAALVEQFELLHSAEVEADDERVTVAVSGSAYGPVEGFDNPVASLLGSGLAHVVDAPVSVEVDATDDGRADALVTCRWEKGD